MTSVAVPDSDPERFSAKEPTLSPVKVCVSAVANRSPLSGSDGALKRRSSRKLRRDGRDNGWVPADTQLRTCCTGIRAIAAVT
jgi:hypothetical protein